MSDALDSVIREDPMGDDAPTVEVVEIATGKVVLTLRCKSDREAEKVERGVSINLNHEAFLTRLRNVVAEVHP